MSADLKTICFFVNKRHAEELMREVVSLFNVNADSLILKQGISDRTVCNFRLRVDVWKKEIMSGSAGGADFVCL